MVRTSVQISSPSHSLDTCRALMVLEHISSSISLAQSRLIHGYIAKDAGNTTSKCWRRPMKRGVRPCYGGKKYSLCIWNLTRECFGWIYHRNWIYNSSRRVWSGRWSNLVGSGIIWCIPFEDHQDSTNNGTGNKYKHRTSGFSEWYSLICHCYCWLECWSPVQSIEILTPIP